MPERARFYVVPIDYPPAPWAVRDRHLRYTIERCATWESAVESRDRAAARSGFERTDFVDFDRCERAGETGEVLTWAR
jgi:hypothetical protein